jgi:hypothetical protein
MNLKITKRKPNEVKHCRRESKTIRPGALGENAESYLSGDVIENAESDPAFSPRTWNDLGCTAPQKRKIKENCLYFIIKTPG